MAYDMEVLYSEVSAYRVSHHNNLSHTTISGSKLYIDTTNVMPYLHTGFECTFTQTYKFVSLVISVVISTSSFFGTALVLVSLAKFSKHFKGTLYMLTGNLALADLLLALGMTIPAVETMFDVPLQDNVYICVTFVSSSSISLLCSGITLMVMSVDRLIAVAFPMLHMVKSRDHARCGVLIACIWIVAVAAGSLPILLNVDYSAKTTLCRFGNIAPKWFTIAIAVSLCVEIMFNHVVGVILLMKIRRRKDKIRSTKESKKASKAGLMVKIYLIFESCWLPFIVFTFLADALPDDSRFVCFREYAFFAGFLNSRINWLIYGLANRKFRKVFKHLLCRCGKKDKSKQTLERTLSNRSSYSSMRFGRENSRSELGSLSTDVTLQVGLI